MRYWIIIAFVGFLFFIPPLVDVFGISESEFPRNIRGQNYVLNEVLVGDLIHGTWSSAPEWVFDGANYQPSIYQEDVNNIKIETAHGSVILDKSTCGFSFFKKGLIGFGDTPLFTDSIIARMATNGTNNWVDINSINNASCQPSWNGSELTARKQSAAGILDYKYIISDDKWKTQLEVTNLSNQTDKKFGFTQTINLNRDTIKYGGQLRNLDNLNGTTFDRTFLEANQAKVLDLLNNVNFDFDLAFDNLWAVTVYDDGVDKSKLAFDFTNDAQIVLPDTTLILDPTFGYTTGTEYAAEVTGGASTSCSSSGGVAILTTDTNNLWTRTNSQATTPVCRGLAWEWDISSINDFVTVTDTKLRFDIDVSSSGVNCEYRAIQYQPSLYTDTQPNALELWNDIVNGTTYLLGDTTCNTLSSSNDNVVDLGTNADSDLKTSIESGQTWWSVGIAYSDWNNRNGVNDNADFDDLELQITYTLDPPPALSDLSCSFNSDPSDYSVDCDWSSPVGPDVLGYQILRDVGDGFNVLVNDTATTNVFYNDTSLNPVSPWHRYDVRGWSGGGLGPASNLQNVTTVDTPDAILTTVPAIVGDVTAANYTLNVSGFPNAVTVSDITTWINDTQTDTHYLLEPVAALHFEGNVNDSAGTNHGTVSGTTTYLDGALGDGFDFDGATQIDLANESNFDFLKAEPFSISYWVKPDNGAQGIHISKKTTWSGEGYSVRQTPSALISFVIDDGTNSWQVSGTTDINDGQWHHIVVTKGSVANTNQMKIYVDGVLEATGDSNTIAADPTNNLTVTLGAFNGGTVDFNGMLDDVRIYDTELTQRDITFLSNQTPTYGDRTDWVLLSDAITTVKHGVDLIYYNGTTQSLNSTVSNQVQEYDPAYFDSVVTSQGQVNYTQNRLNNQDTVHLKVNRDKSGATFQIECLYQTASQAQFANQTGTWDNKTDVGWYNGTINGFQNSNAYITCYNDDWLFTTISYTNSSLSLSGIQAFDDIYGGFLGVPVAVFFLVLVAGYANPRTAPIWLVVILGMAGVMSATQFVTLSTEIWALMLVAGIMGLFVGRKFF